MPPRIAWILIAVILQIGAVRASAATPEAQPKSDSESGEPLANAPEDGFGGPEANAYGSNEALDWTVAIYPIYAWAPLFGASVDSPNVPPPPGGGGGGGIMGGHGATNTSFNGSAFAAISVQEKRWIVGRSWLWAGLSAERTSPHLHVKVNTDAIYGQFMGGYQIYRHIALTGGFRRMGLKVRATLGDQPEVSWKPGVWDPLVGLDWRTALGRKWFVIFDVAGGGFGVGSDVDISGALRADWRFTRHFGMTLGYGLEHFQITTTVSKHDFTTKQTLNGPIFGFGIFL